MPAITAAGSKTGLMANSARQEGLARVIKTGLEILKGNPWDVSTLTSHGPGLRRDGAATKPNWSISSWRRDFNPKDVERQPACAAGRWAGWGISIRPSSAGTRVEQLKPGDEEAGRAIGDLTVEKTIHVGGYEDAETTKDVKRAHADADDDEQAKLTPEQRLEKQITKQPGRSQPVRRTGRYAHPRRPLGRGRSRC